MLMSENPGVEFSRMNRTQSEFLSINPLHKQSSERVSIIETSLHTYRPRIIDPKSHQKVDELNYALLENPLGLKPQKGDIMNKPLNHNFYKGKNVNTLGP